MPPQPDHEHRVVTRGPDGKVRSSTSPSEDARAIGGHYRAVREEARGNPEIASVEIQKRPVNPNEWQSVEIATNRP